MNELIKKLSSEFQDAEYAHAYLAEQSNIHIAAQVRALRLQMQLSQAQLAELTSMRQERISKIEMADFDSLTLTTLRRLAEAFDVHMKVEFASIADAVVDFATLTPESLLCEKRETSLRRMQIREATPAVTITHIHTAWRHIAQYGAEIDNPPSTPNAATSPHGDSFISYA